MSEILADITQRVSDKPSKDPKDKVEPVPSDKDLFEWWEGLFDGAGEFPEFINVHAVSGPQYARLGPQIEQYIYKPQIKGVKQNSEGRDGEDAAAVVEHGRPSREKIVATINRVRALCQRDCDQQRKSVVYGAHAMHFLRSEGIYSRFIFRLEPKGIHAAKRGGYSTADDDESGDEEMTPQLRYHNQKLGHDERMFNMYGAALEGAFDRLDKVLEREYMTNERLRLQNERQAEIIEKLQSNASERDRQAKWDDLKMRTVERGFNLVADLAPPLLGQLTGKSPAGIQKTPESITLDNFLKLDTQGGSLTVHQVEAAFGVYTDDEPRKLIKPGVLSDEQAHLLLHVAKCVVPADDLDRILPGGDLEITGTQQAQLMQIFTPDQILPLGALIQSRMQRRQKQQQNIPQQPNQ